jgi:putative MATE family efflux protein
MEDKRILLLKEEKVSKSVLLMAVPAIIGLIVQAVYNMVDTMFVSWLGPTATGATQIVFVLYTAVAAVGGMFGIGLSTYIARLLGMDKKDQADKAFSTVFIGALVTGIIVTIISFLFLTPILKLVGATPSLMGMSKDYAFFLTFSYLFMIMNMLLNNSLRGEGSAKFSMIGMGIGALLNIILDPIFIFTLNMGIKGAAIATSLSQVVTTVILISYYLRKKTLINFSFKSIKAKKCIWIEVLKVGLPSFVTQILMSISISFINNQAGLYGGDNAIAAIGIVTKLVFIIMYIFFGLGMGFQPIAGYCFGSNRYKRLLDALRFTIKISVIIGIVCNILILLFGSSFIAIFKPTPEVFDYAIFYLKIFMISILIMSVQFNVIFFYQAIGKGLVSLIIGITRQGLFLIPLVLILPKYFGINGVFFAQAIADILIFIIASIMLLVTTKKYRKMIQ